LADCNAVWGNSGAIFPLNACSGYMFGSSSTSSNYSTMYVCDSNDDGYLLTWSGTSDCEGDASSNSSVSVVYDVKCTESSDCSYETFDGYKDSNGDCANDTSDGGYYYTLNLVTGCSESSGSSYKYTCNADGNPVGKAYYSDDCSESDISLEWVYDQCLYSDTCDDGAVEMTVKAVFAVVAMAAVMV